MKIRQNYVSNSSSSSCVIDNWKSLSERKKKMILEYRTYVKATWVANGIPIREDSSGVEIDESAIEPDSELSSLRYKLDFGYVDNGWHFHESDDGGMTAFTIMDNFDLGMWLKHIKGVKWHYEDY